MQKLALGICFLIIFFTGKSFAQSDNFSGTWEAAGQINSKPVTVRINIGTSEKYILYPAKVHITIGEFSGKYDLLLVRKNSRELSISRNKYTGEEYPKISPVSIFLNGTLDRSKDLKGNFILTFKELDNSINYSGMKDNASVSDYLQNLPSGFSDKELVFTKTSDSVITGLLPDIFKEEKYFGLVDTIHLEERIGAVTIMNDRKKSSDKVSLSLNGKIILEDIQISKKPRREELVLDTGLNIITMFAENFSDNAVNRSSFQFIFGKQEFRLGFNDKQDSAAPFIAVRVYNNTDNITGRIFPSYYGEGYPPVTENEKLITSLRTRSGEITLAVWDDAREDGDTISISIDGEWIVEKIRVLNKPQFIKVSLAPGVNTINFIANNVGSIPPNTSMLEIIDGLRRKSYNISTGMETKNLVRIFYESGN